MLSVQDRRIRVLKSNMWVGQENYLLQRKVYEKDCGYTGGPEDHPSFRENYVDSRTGRLISVMKGMLCEGQEDRLPLEESRWKGQKVSKGRLCSFLNREMYSM